MARRGPSLTALLGLLAVAGFKNRDKLGDLAQRMQTRDVSEKVSPDFVDQIKGLLGGTPVGGALSGAMGELVALFKGTPQEAPVQSWVGSGQNSPVTPDELQTAIGSETLQELSDKTGMSTRDLLAALSQGLPDAVNTMTPHGRLPSEDEAGNYV